MRNNPRLTHIKGPEEFSDHIVDAEFEEVDEFQASAQRQKKTEERVSLKQWFYQQHILVRLLISVLILPFFFLCIIALVMAAFSESPSATQHQEVPSPPMAKTNTPPEERAATPDSIIAEGDCRIGACNWLNIKTQIVSEQNKGTQLVLMNISAGISPNTGSQSRDSEQITWGNAQRQAYAFCSLNLPALMTEANGKWHADIFDFTETLPGIFYDNADLYSYACHGKLGAWRQPDFAEFFGYKSPRYNTLDIEKPEDITSF